ncbi:ATP-dependent Clp protease proteolytic subunit [Zunongwangia atlantica]|uniref:ClpP protease n=1 Tax=Zunongwangia atlantica 22II14-10F7 TaxID=1185767 RepID=A0A1Y1T2Y4_9FLAO|nr:ATP-dependent Clp protease proteolytic subunit [Zunongwangia atlantica]ORL45399.1 ClpP protease [Zunongwangia atlantica 22II14-10F7]
MSRKATIFINGVIGEDTSLIDVIRQFKSFKKPDSVEVIIDSVGGEVDEGQSIYSYLRNLQLPITTKATMAYSIAASIFMAGDKRLLAEGEDRFMIHLPWAQMQGNSSDFEYVAKQLKEIENNFINFYSVYTSIDKKTVEKLLQKETFLSASNAVKMGFATGSYTSIKAVAFYNNEKNNNEKEMTKTDKFLKALASFISGSDLEKDVEKDLEINALTLQDSNGNEVTFPDLNTGDTPSIGDAVEAEGDEILMPDGSKILIEDGKVKEILPAPEEQVEETETSEDEANAVEETEIETSEDADEDEIDFEEILKKLEAEILKKAEAKFNEKEEKLNAEIKALKKSIGSEIENEPNEVQKLNNNKNNSLRSALQKRK